MKPDPSIRVTELTKADVIWNRACTPNETLLLAGDRALATMLRFHGLAMNGGVLHALECSSAQALKAAISGYEFFGFYEVAGTLSEARSIADNFAHPDLIEARLDRRYKALIPSDTTLFERFSAYLLGNPSAFALPS